jgi:hypothetical protein
VDRILERNLLMALIIEANASKIPPLAVALLLLGSGVVCKNLVADILLDCALTIAFDFGLATLLPLTVVCLLVILVAASDPEDAFFLVA